MASKKIETKKNNLISVEFIYIPKIPLLNEREQPEAYSKLALIESTSDFKYRGGLTNKEDINLVKKGFDLMRKTGVQEKIASPDDYFPDKFRVIYSLSYVDDENVPRLHISPLEGEEILWSCLGNLNRSRRTHPIPSIIEARTDGIDLDYGFANLTLNYEPIEHDEILTLLGGRMKRK